VRGTVELMTVEPEGSKYRASGRMKNALVADQVMADLEKSSDHLLTDPMGDEKDWTEHLAHQLSINRWGPGDVHDTLMFVLQLLDERLRVWPPAHTPTDLQPIADAATKNMDPDEVYDLLLRGPGRWRQKQVSDGITVDGLATVLKPILARELAGELSRLFDRWVAWDIPKLKERREEAIKVKEAAERAKAAAERAARQAKRPSRAEMQARLANNRGTSYTPPGRT
jgi:hypothetical protein